MASDATYESCLPILYDPTLEEEEKTEKIEDLVRVQLALEEKALQDVVLNVLWRFRSAKNPSKSTPPLRHAVVRQSSPSPWQHVTRSSTPSLAGSPIIGRSSPAPSTGFGVARPAFIRSKSFGTASPFGSPRPSPQLGYATPIPHSPSLSNYEFSDGYIEKNDYGDYGSDIVDGLVNDEAGSRPSSSGGGGTSESGLNATASPWIQPPSSGMSSYDMLRSVMGEAKTNEEIETALESHGYDLNAAIIALMGSNQEQSYFPDNDSQILIGKSMTPSQPIVIDQAERGRSNVICKYWLSNGNCLRADCRFSHDLSSHVCKYWLMNSCLAGDSCMFSHDPALLMSRMNVNDGTASTPPTQLHPSLQVQDHDAFPSLQPAAQSQHYSSSPSQAHVYKHTRSPGSSGFIGSSRRQFEPRSSMMNGTTSSYDSTGSRPTSRHRSPKPNHVPVIPVVDDAEAFPSLSNVGIKVAKKHHGKRGGHGHGHNKENVPNSLADVMRMSPDPAPGILRKGLEKTRTYSGTSPAATSIPGPKHIPWLETGAKANQEYLKARQDAFRHGGLRNKFLQSAAQAWNRNDARAAKALSLRGQSENDLMRKSHREAARLLYESRNKESSTSPEIYVDLHGLHPDEAVDYLEQALVEQQNSNQPVYAIIGTGHHSKNGKDKVGKAVLAWLNEWKYAFREFSVGGDGMGGILGIDPKSFDKGLVKDEKPDEDGGEEVGGKVRVVKAVDRDEKGEAG